MRNDPQLEAHVLGQFLIDDAGYSRPLVRSLVDSRDFHNPAHAHIFDAMCSVLDRGEWLDMLTLCAELKARDKLNAVGGPQYLGAIYDDVCETASAEGKARLLAELSRARRLQRAGETIRALAIDDTVPVTEAAEKARREVADAAAERFDSLRSSSDVVMEVDRELQSIQRGEPEARGLHTGLADVDSVLCGMLGGELIVIAARPGMGKTALAAQLGHNVARTGPRVLFFSLEMLAKAVKWRLAGGLSGVDIKRFRATRDPEDGARLQDALQILSTLPIDWDDDGRVTAEQIRQRTLAAHARSPVGLVIVDYLQKVKGAPGSKDQRERVVADVADQLKCLAKEISCPVIALAQLNREVESRAERRPQVSDLRESGAIEAEADAVLLLHREGYYDPNADQEAAELIVGKQRSGYTPTIRLTFRREITWFEDAPQGEGSVPSIAKRRRYPGPRAVRGDE